ncbi:MAG: MBL fold metallo-hydrolase [Pseudomonadota bacterium]|nr:MBL fold metallo-hydrolase [Pseudomonadota bacterium]MEE3100497.1 MBL fold metallo-hydrolase [Pseudomonadota bacterium]
MSADPLLPPVFRVGDVEVIRVIEILAPFRLPEETWPESAEEVRAALDALGDDLPEGLIDPETGMVILAIQTYVLKTARRTIVVDTCVGCDKTYPSIPAWHQRTNRSWLARMAAAGVAPESVDYVLCTHLHGDHVGWNTQLLDGRWVPTFPNATYLMTSVDEAYVKQARPATWAESVNPVIEAGQARLVETDYALDDEVWLEPTPGHTPGHVAVRIKSNGEEAVLTGDTFHSPLQCRFPDWRFFSDDDPARAVITRRALFESLAESGRLVLPAHFPPPTVGWVTVEGDAFGFRYKAF